ncbi:MAG TPA: 16S rRNA (cytidine(1402)-2'-O)-methyltransferase [bacterium]|mgnify:CR=1 FL=1|nr:16S rRNA (cytidine(1402)-2'-O)-methyltransferase [bacterium]HPT30043.1 16S rRNA (cytidine(1402)-2'-O)-methyltransferase [bacterium]
MATLYIVATPIGNLSDITLRALEILKQVDYVLCEDTRNSRKLLEHFQISTPTVSYHEHSKINKVDQIISWLEDGKDLALVSDAGTPGISDPGNKLIAEILARNSAIDIKCVPGPSALAAALSLSGINCDHFTFLGFLPHKKGRQTELKEIAKEKYPIICYESKYRIVKLLGEINEMMPSKKIILFKELTKIHEKSYRGSAQEILKELAKDPAATKGEFVIIIY